MRYFAFNFMWLVLSSSTKPSLLLTDTTGGGAKAGRLSGSVGLVAGLTGAGRLGSRTYRTCAGGGGVKGEGRGGRDHTSFHTDSMRTNWMQVVNAVHCVDHRDSVTVYLSQHSPCLGGQRCWSCAG